MFSMLSFRQMLTSQSWLDGRKSELVLQEHDDCFDVFEDFLRSAVFFIWAGYIDTLLGIIHL